MTPYCDPVLQEKLKPGNERIKSLMDAKPSDATPPVEPKSQSQLYQDLGIPQDLIQDVGSNVSGWYELCAVLTHVGRAADSGHYIGWTRSNNTPSSSDPTPNGATGTKQDVWYKFDDDKVSQVTSEDVLKLEGGGDWHTAYIVLYRAKKL